MVLGLYGFLGRKIITFLSHSALGCFVIEQDDSFRFPFSTFSITFSFGKMNTVGDGVSLLLPDALRNIRKNG
jgi:hypothetical protein